MPLFTANTDSDKQKNKIIPVKIASKMSLFLMDFVISDKNIESKIRSPEIPNTINVCKYWLWGL